MPPIYLNHLLIFVDIETYRAIVHSDILKQQFAWSEDRTTHDEATGMSWTGCYFYGQHTYFEFMNPEATSWAPRDGIAFGVEKENASLGIENRLRSNIYPLVRRYSRSRKYKNLDMPWFWTVEIPRDDNHRLMTWVMEYRSEFLKQWAPDLAPAIPGITRRQILTRYRSDTGEISSTSRLFQDITSVTLSLPQAEARLLNHELLTYGYKANELEGQVVYTGPDISLCIESHEELPAGILAFTMKTSPVEETTTYQFSKSCRLTLYDHGEAEWSLR